MSIFSVETTDRSSGAAGSVIVLAGDAEAASRIAAANNVGVVTGRTETVPGAVLGGGSGQAAGYEVLIGEVRAMRRELAQVVAPPPQSILGRPGAVIAIGFALAAIVGISAVAFIFLGAELFAFNRSVITQRP